MTRNVNALVEMTPPEVDDAIAGFVRDVGCEPAEFIPVLSGAGARPDASVAIVSDAVSRLGGSVRFGRIVTACPGLWIAARFHAARRTPAGLLVDHSPSCRSQTRSLFAINRSVASPDVRDQPRPIRLRTYRCPDDASADSRNLASAIDDYLRLLAEFDAAFVAGPSRRECIDARVATKLAEAVPRAHRRLSRLHDVTHRAVSVSMRSTQKRCRQSKQ